MNWSTYQCLILSMLVKWLTNYTCIVGQNHCEYYGVLNEYTVMKWYIASSTQNIPYVLALMTRHIFCSEWSSVGYGTGALRDLWNWSIAQHSIDLCKHYIVDIKWITSSQFLMHWIALSLGKSIEIWCGLGAGNGTMIKRSQFIVILATMSFCIPL